MPPLKYETQPRYAFQEMVEPMNKRKYSTFLTSLGLALYLFLALR